jgi:nucleotidyltransferase substrate binding protein (TIGR01987 family)
LTQRWKQRFEYFEKAYSLLKKSADSGFSSLSELERMGCTQAFEITFELSWKVMKDYLIYTGVPLTEFTPRQIIREAFSAGIISNGETWLIMLNNRNLTTHTYDEAHIKSGLDVIEKEYLPHMTQLYNFLKDRIHDN